MSSPYGAAQGLIDEVRKIPEGVDNAVSQIPGASRFARYFAKPQAAPPQDTSGHAQMVEEANQTFRQRAAAEAFKKAQMAKLQNSGLRPAQGE